MCSDGSVRGMRPTERRVKTWLELLRIYNDDYNKPPSEGVRWVFRGDRSDGNSGDTILYSS